MFSLAFSYCRRAPRSPPQGSVTNGGCISHRRSHRYTVHERLTRSTRATCAIRFARLRLFWVLGICPPQGDCRPLSVRSERRYATHVPCQAAVGSQRYALTTAVWVGKLFARTINSSVVKSAIVTPNLRRSHASSTRMFRTDRTRSSAESFGLSMQNSTMKEFKLPKQKFL